MSFTSSTVPPTTEIRALPRRRSESFSLLQLDAGPPRKRAFTAGFFIQVILIGLFAWMAAYSPKLEKPNIRESVVLVAPNFNPPPEPQQPKVIAPRLPKIVPRVAPPMPVEEPKIEPPKVEAKVEPIKPLPQPPLPTPKKEAPAFASAAPVAPPLPPKPEVKTNVFEGSSATPTIKAPAKQVQTGGFGDPNGFKGEAQEAKLNAPKLGGFDMPSGPGNGNGLGGAHGKQGVVASAGFGSGVATGTTGRETPGGGVHAGGFGDASVGGAGTPTPVKASAQPAMMPVEVLEKPDPQYTQEARNLKIEGEVHLKVLFQANGHVQVLQVVRGLGHGLDEAATAAAQKIRFKPAQRDGRPCDMTATVHIVFQLAS